MPHPLTGTHGNYFFAFICSPQHIMSHVSMQPHASSTETTSPHTSQVYLSPFLTSFFFLPTGFTDFFTAFFFAAAFAGFATVFFVAIILSFHLVIKIRPLLFHLSCANLRVPGLFFHIFVVTINNYSKKYFECKISLRSFIRISVVIE